MTPAHKPPVIITRWSYNQSQLRDLSRKMLIHRANDNRKQAVK